MSLFFRIESEISEFAEKEVASLPEWQFVSSDATFLDPAFAGGQFLKAVAKRLSQYGHSLENIKSRLFGYEDNEVYLNHPLNITTHKIANLSVVHYNELMNNKNCKETFTTILGNPPYNKGILPKNYKSKIARGNASIAFIEESLSRVQENGIVKLVLPTNFMTLPSMVDARNYLLDNSNVLDISIYNNKEKKYFDISNQNVLVLTLSTGLTHDTLIHRENFVTGEWATTQVDLRQFSFWPMSLGPIEYNILKKVLDKKVGELNVHNGPNWIFMANMGDNNSLNHTRHWVCNNTRSTVKCPIRIYFDDQAHCELYYQFTQTKLYNLLLNMVKSTPKNQPKVLSYIGDFNFEDENFDHFFGLTNEELTRIEENY